MDSTWKCVLKETMEPKLIQQDHQPQENVGLQISQTANKAPSYTQISDYSEDSDCNSVGKFDDTCIAVESTSAVQQRNGIYDRLHYSVCDKISNIQLSLENILLIVTSQHKTAATLLPEAISELTPKEAKRREIRVSEFKARFRRNYIYPLQIEVDRDIQYLNCHAIAPSLETNISALRSLEKAHMQAFRALQVFQQQSHALVELLLDNPLLEDLFTQLARMIAISKAVGIHNKNLELLCHKLQLELANSIPKRAHVGPADENKKQQVPAPVCVGRESFTVLSNKKSKHCKPALNKKNSTKSDKQQKKQIIPSNQSPGKIFPKACSSQDQIQQPVNVKVVMMQHTSTMHSQYTTCRALQEAATQTLCQTSNTAETDVTDLHTEENVHKELNEKVQDLLQKDDAGDTEKINITPFTEQLQNAVLERLKNDNYHDLDLLIEQLMQEEFL